VCLVFCAHLTLDCLFVWYLFASFAFPLRLTPVETMNYTRANPQDAHATPGPIPFALCTLFNSLNSNTCANGNARFAAFHCLRIRWWRTQPTISHSIVSAVREAMKLEGTAFHICLQTTKQTSNPTQTKKERRNRNASANIPFSYALAKPCMALTH
jgi:hypothetical protein